MKKLLGKIYLNRNITYIGLFLLVAIIILGLPKSASAIDVAATLKNLGATLAASPILLAIGIIAALVMVLFGMIDTMIIGALVNISKYNDFISEPSISDAWVVVRDLCNMFFILILLVIAFATILRLPNYEWKKLLPKLLIMAVLINFSKTICGLIIDFSQVIMMTFVNAWGGAGNFVSMLNMAKFFAGVTTKGFTSPDWSVLNVVAGMLIGIMFLVISGIVLLVALAVFLMRVIMLWIYIVLSPLAFLAAAFPAGQKYATQWWTEFTRYIINGPVLAFFIWLALITSKQITDSESLVFNNPANTDQCFSIIQGMCMNNFMPFILSIGMLLGGLMITQQIGGVGSGMAAKGLDWAKKSPMLLGKGTMKVGGWGARKFAKTKYGFQINPFEIGRGIKESFEEKKVHDLSAGRTRGKELLEKGGIRGVLGGLGAGPDWADNYISGVANWKGFAGIAKSLTHGTGWRKKRNKELAGKEEELNKYKDYYGSQAEKDKDIKKQQTKKSLLNEQMIILNTQYDEAKDKKEQDAIEESRVKVRGGIKKIEDEEATINLRGIDAEKGAKKEALQKDIKGIKDELTKYMAPRGFKGRAASQALVNEEMKKISDIQNDELLISYLKDAMNKKDKYRVMAIAKKMTADGNDNEWLNALDYDSNAIGLTKFVEEELIKKMGINKQEALAFQDDISYSAERVNHWETAKTVGVGADGRLQSLVKYDSKTGKWDDSRHAQAAFAEIMKLDPQVIARNLNRLAYGGERMRADGSGRDFMISTLGLMLTKALGDSADFVDKHGGRFNINTSQNLSTPETIKVMMEAGIKPDFIQMAVKKGISKEGIRLDPENVWKIIDEVAKKLRDELYKKDAENAQKIIS